MSAKGDKTKELICSEAYKLFAEKGFKEVTMKDICEKTGLSRGGLYRKNLKSTTMNFLKWDSRRSLQAHLPTRQQDS